MKLGTQTGSLVNHVMTHNTKGDKPEVGMGVTFFSWSDRDAGTIHAVRTEGMWEYIEISRDNAKMVAGSEMSEEQDYEFTPNPDGYRMTFRRKLGTEDWVYVIQRESTGRWVKGGDKPIRLGARDKYRDPSF